MHDVIHTSRCQDFPKTCSQFFSAAYFIKETPQERSKIENLYSKEVIP